MSLRKVLRPKIKAAGTVLFIFKKYDKFEQDLNPSFKTKINYELTGKQSHLATETVV